MEKQQKSYFLYFAAFSINFLAFECGVCYSWTSPFIPKFQSNDSSINPISRPVTTTEAGLLVSIINLGLLMGPTIPALVADKFGKKTTLILGATPLLVAHILCSFTKRMEVFLVARFLMGIVTGIMWSTTPSYVAEISEPRNRGILSSLIAVLTSCGYLFVYCVGPFLSMTWFSIANVIPVVVFLTVMLLFIPASPYDLIKQNKIKQAEDSLIKLRGRTNVGTELAEIQKSIEAETSSGGGKFMDLFRNTNLIRPMIISLGVMIICPFSGICAVLGYTQTIFELAGSSIPSAYSAIIVGVISIITTLIHSSLVDRLGRKILMVASCGILCLSLSALGAFFFLKQNNFKVDALAWIPLISLVLYMFGYYLGVGIIPYTILGELFPPNIKAVAVGFLTSINFSITFFVTLGFPYSLEILSPAYTFWFIAFCMAAGFIFSIKVIPETKGKSLQEITVMLSRKG